MRALSVIPLACHAIYPSVQHTTHTRQLIKARKLARIFYASFTESLLRLNLSA